MNGYHKICLRTTLKKNGRSIFETAKLYTIKTNLNNGTAQFLTKP